MKREGLDRMFTSNSSCIINHGSIWPSVKCVYECADLKRLSGSSPDSDVIFRHVK